MSIPSTPPAAEGTGPHDYRTNAIVNALTSIGAELLPWQIDALDRLVLLSAKEEE